MSLVAVHAAGQHAHVLTDTLSYSSTQRHLRRTSKVTVVPHLNAAVLHHGSRDFGRFWVQEAQTMAGADNYDQLVDRAPARLDAVWDELVVTTEHRNAIHGTEFGLPRSVAIAVGYSDRAGEFRAHAWASDDYFAPQELAGVFVMPSPLTARPSELELGRLRGTLVNLHGLSYAVSIARDLDRQPALTPPTTDEEWAALAQTIRRDRALADLYSGLKMYVGGDALLTRLERGSSSTRRLVTFDDDGAEFAQMMAGSLHPVGQLGPCACGSGRPAVDCCLRELDDQPCPCGSTATFATCCRVEAAPA